MGRDVQRHLENEPVLARPPSTAYRLRKAVQRNRAISFSVLLVTTAVLLALAISLRLYRQEKQAHELVARSEREQSHLREAAEQARANEVQLRERAEAVSAQLRESLYAADVQTAQGALARSDRGLARVRLARSIPAAGEADLRGWEWRYLWNQAQGEDYASIALPVMFVLEAKLSPDGKYLAMRTLHGEDGVYIFDPIERRQIHRFELKGPMVSSIDFSPDGRYLALAWEGEVVLFETGSWRLVKRVPDVSYPAVFSPDGKYLACGAATNVALVATADWHVVRQFPAFWRADALFSPDSRQLLSFGDAGARIYQLPEGRRVDLADSAGLLFGWKRGAGAFSADSRFVFIGCMSGEVRRYDTATGALAASATTGNHAISDLRVSPDGELLAGTSFDSTVRIWNARNLRLLRTFQGHLSESWSVAFLGTNQIVTGGKDGAVRFWRIGTPERVAWQTFTNQPPRAHLEFEPGGALALVHEGGANLIDLATGRESQRASYQPNHRYRAEQTDAGWKLFEAATQKVLLQFPTAPQCFDLSPAKRLFAGWFPSSNSLVFAHLDTGEPSTIPRAHADPNTQQISFSPDGTLLVSANMSGEPRVWDVATKKLKFPLLGHRQGVPLAIFSPDGRTIATTGDTTVKLWSAATGLEMLSFDLGTAAASLAFSPDQRHLCVRDERGTVRVYSAPLLSEMAMGSRR